MPETFLVGPSEALLLGLCLEEYLCYQAEGEFPPRRYFLDIVRSRLVPHVDSFRTLRVVETHTDKCPHDIERLGIFGKARSAPDKLFAFQTEEKVSVAYYDTSRKSLLDRLVGSLWEYVSRTYSDRCNLAPDSVVAITALFAGITRKSHDESIFQRDGKEVPSSIQAFIERLVKVNECDHVFHVGRRFGSLVYAIDEFESYVWSIEERREEFLSTTIGELWIDECDKTNEHAEEDALKEFEEWVRSNLTTLREKRPPHLNDGQWEEVLGSLIETKQSEIMNRHMEWASEHLANWEPPEVVVEFRPVKRAAIKETAKTLLETDVIRRCLHAHSLLENLQQIESRLIFDLTKDQAIDIAQRTTIPHVADARMALWLAFGEVLGVLKDADVEVRLSDAQSATSRTFKLQPADSPDVVFDRLLKVEEELNSRAEITSEEIVERLGPVIEALAKRIWPQDFMPKAGFRGELATVLWNRVTPLNPDNSTLDQRFAAVAIALYKQYRIPAQHGLGEFKCSFEEARFFLAGIRTLVDLWKRSRETAGK